jgi:hypothetical protein
VRRRRGVSGCMHMDCVLFPCKILLLFLSMQDPPIVLLRPIISSKHVRGAAAIMTRRGCGRWGKDGDRDGSTCSICHRDE